MLSDSGVVPRSVSSIRTSAPEGSDSTLSKPVDVAGERNANAAHTPTAMATTPTPIASATMVGIRRAATTGSALAAADSERPASLSFVSLANSKVASSRADDADVEDGFARNGATVFALAESGVTIRHPSAMHANQVRRDCPKLNAMTRIVILSED